MLSGLPAESGAFGGENTPFFLVDPPLFSPIKTRPRFESANKTVSFRQEITDSSLLVKDSYDFSAKESLSRAEVAEDIAVLEYALRHGYIGGKYIDNAIFSAVLKRLDELAQNTAISSSRDLCNETAKILWNIPDGHLGVGHWDVPGCGTGVLWPKPGSVGNNVATQREKPWEIQWFKLGADNIPVVSITRFPSHADLSWTGFLDSFRLAIAAAPAVVFDLRGNAGGDSATAAYLAEILYGQAFPYAEESKKINKTPAAYFLQANYYKTKILAYQQQGKTPDPSLLDLLDEYLTDAAAARPDGEETFYFPDYAVNPDKLWKHPIYLLTDRNCGSSGETMVEYFEAHPYAKTVGDNTRGLVHFGNVGTLTLPNSQVYLQMSTTFKTFKDRRFVEKTGYAPRIRVPDGEDALKYAYDDLARQLTPP